MFRAVARSFRGFTRWARIRMHHARYGEGFPFHGRRVHVPDWTDWTIKRELMRGTYEAPERALFDRCFRPDLPVVELGGSIGVLSSYVASRLNANTRYVIVEANPHVIPVTRQNVREREDELDIHIVNAAVAYGSERVEFAANLDFLASRIATKAEEHSVSVEAITLGDVLREYDISGDYIAIIDIEGTEYDVFENDMKALQQAAVVIVETHPSIFEENGRELGTLLQRAEAAGLKVEKRIADSFAFVREAV